MSFKSLVFIYCCLLISQAVFSQQHDLQYYQNKAHKNNATLKENINLQKFNLLQNEMLLAQYSKPQLSFTADYLFAPFFFNKGQIISITQNPEKNAFGYDAGLTNGGLYAAQLNASYPLFTERLINIYKSQNAIQNQILQFGNKQVLHDMDKAISDQFISVYQLQQILNIQQKITVLIESRRVIVEALVQKALMQQNDYLLLEIEIKQLQFDIQQTKINLITAFIQLNNLCSIKDTTSVELIAPSISQTLLSNQFNFKKKYILDSTSIIAQQQVFNIKYRPQLSAFGNTGINAADASNIPHNIGISAGLHLLIPLYDGGQKKIVELQNKLLLDNLKEYQNQNMLLTGNNLNALQQQIVLTEQSINLINSQLSSQETLLQIIKDKVVTGQVSVTDYLKAIQDYAVSSQNKVQAQTNLWLLINQYNYINW